MSKKYRVVVIGSGIVGASAVWHFAKAGWKDILLIDKGELWENDGSTSHAPGGVVALSHSKLLTQMAVYGADLMASLKPWSEDRMTYNGVGGLDVATSERRWNDLKRLHGESKSYGVEAHLLSPDEVKIKSPLVNPEEIFGGIFIPKGAIVAGAHVSAALVRDAGAMSNVDAYGNTAVTDFEVKDGRIVALSTSNPELPRIECESALICANIWSPALCEKLGIQIPLVAFEHQYVITTPMPELAQYADHRKEDEVHHVGFRDVDHTMYCRFHWDSIGVGSYWHRPHMVYSRDVKKSAMHPFTPEDFAGPWEHFQKLAPALKGINSFIKSFNGMFAFSVDGMPIIGESHVKGLWVATGSWLTHAPGVAKCAVEWMTSGETEWDMRQVHLHRFQTHVTTRNFMDRISLKNYREIYEIVHPRQPLSEPRNVRLTPFYPRHKDLKASFTAFAGIEVPNWNEENTRLLEKYEDKIPARSGWAAEYWSPVAGAEHLATRESAGLFDLTGLALIEVSGPGALKFVNYLCSNDMDKPVGQVMYTLWLTKNGGVRRDLAVARLAEDKFWMMVGDGTRPQDLVWVRSHAPTNGSVVITDVSDGYTALGLWGPNARNILSKVTQADLSNDGFPFYSCQWIEVGPAWVLAVRISYAGELGWELHIPFDQDLQVWDAIWEAGREFDLISTGMTAFDTLRLEKGYRLWGGDVTTEYNAYEAGLGWTVKLDKQDDFLGKAASKTIKEKGPKKKLCCLTLDNPRGAAFGYEPIFSNGACVGHVTSANYGYSVSKYILYGYLPKEYATVGAKLEIEYFGERHPVTVAPDPLFDPKGERMKA
ncbi:MAG: FAD-dependent oxidoreductase [Chloroflexi bacterium]|nr:FAD-dependent oxidoreductase [Chloroflexota bacterium]